MSVGGVAGLASAAAALEIFDSVVLIDKDELMPSNPEQELEQFDKVGILNALTFFGTRTKSSRAHQLIFLTNNQVQGP